VARIAGVVPDRAQGPKKAVFEAQTSQLFSRVLGFFDEDALVELTATIAWENSSSKFNRVLRVSSQCLWRGAKS
jgi:hypothetical protein